MRSRPSKRGNRSTRRKERRGGLTEEEQAESWECLWLDQQRTRECLAWVKENGPCHVHLPPMFAFAVIARAHRRSELARSERDDWDFEAGTVSIRQKKAFDKSKTFTRRNVQIPPRLGRRDEEVV